MASAPSLLLAIDTSTDLWNLGAFLHISLSTILLPIGENKKCREVRQDRRRGTTGLGRRRKMREREGS